MRRQVPIANQLYSHLFPHPGPGDPASFAAHLAKNLVPEVRIEVATFYGDLSSAEARYPGLNYCHGPHRMRLGRFKHHRRLFEAFDALGLTYNEIQDFCCWEGTRWARERYERDEGVTVVDTTGDEIAAYVDRREVSSGGAAGPEDTRRKSITRQTDISVVVEEAELDDGQRQPQPQPQQQQRQEEEQANGDASVGGLENTIRPFDASQQSPARRRRREIAMDRAILAAWEHGQGLTPEMEQWLKDQRERGLLTGTTLRRHPQRTTTYTTRPNRANSSSMVSHTAA